MHSQIGFKVKHLMFTNVRGSFTEYNASISTDGNDFTTAEINVSINAASISTNDSKRDKHLRSADFFDVEKIKRVQLGPLKLDVEPGKYRSLTVREVAALKAAAGGKL